MVRWLGALARTTAYYGALVRTLAYSDCGCWGKKKPSYPLTDRFRKTFNILSIGYTYMVSAGVRANALTALNDDVLRLILCRYLVLDDVCRFGDDDDVGFS